MSFIPSEAVSNPFPRLRQANKYQACLVERWGQSWFAVTECLNIAKHPKSSVQQFEPSE
jgi:hypothetical protein